MTKRERIYKWTATRAGGAITVYGKTEEGNPRRIVGVKFLSVDAFTRELVAVAADASFTLDLEP